MLTTLGLTILLFAASIPDGEAALVARAEGAPIRLQDGKTISRVEKDAAGNVVRLNLHEMTLSAEEIASLGRLTALKSLVLYKTNVKDADLRQLRGLTHLEGLNLTSTGISDAAVPDILALKSLRSLCLGNVAITPSAVARLKEEFRTQGRELALGYSQRK